MSRFSDAAEVGVDMLIYLILITLLILMKKYCNEFYFIIKFRCLFRNITLNSVTQNIRNTKKYRMEMVYKGICLDFLNAARNGVVMWNYLILQKI